jgi:phosphotransferase system  glucose/maltose/N-acetylglucosamine-specific IIC component
MEKDQHLVYEYARRRIKQKKGLYFHFVVFLIGGFFMFIMNKWVGIVKENNWYVWVNTAWLFFFLLHFIKVFITDSFMNKNWEREQIDRLMAKQEKKIEQLQNEIDNTPK